MVNMLSSCSPTGFIMQYFCPAAGARNAIPSHNNKKVAKAIVGTIFLNILKNQNADACIDFNIDPSLRHFEADTITNIYDNIERHLKDNQAFSDQDLDSLNAAIKDELTRSIKKSSCTIGISSIMLLGSITAIGLNAGGVISCSPCFGVTGTLIKPYCISLQHKDRQRKLEIQIELTPRITPVIANQPLSVTHKPIENTTEESEA